MNFLDVKYSRLKETLENYYKNVGNWEDVKKLNFNYNYNLDVSKESFIAYTIQSSINGPVDDDPIKLWNELIDFLASSTKETKVNKMGKTVFNDAIIPRDSQSSWINYKNKLIEKGWHLDAVNSIEEDSYEILKHLSPDTYEKDPVKGLVMGNVQSGKTANMAGLMAMAADHGFNFFIILTGTIESLRKQTSNRLYGDLKKHEQSSLEWEQIEQPALSKLHEAKYNISDYKLRDTSKKRYFVVSLKNHSRLEQLFNWMNSDKNKAKQLKILIIDDEADQASINTKKGHSEYTTINRLIREFVHQSKVKAMNYIAYTATPYANVLSEATKDSLYPADFIYMLEQSPDYIGPKEIFGIQSPEETSKYPIVNQISDYDVEIVRDIHENSLVQIPASLREALQWFLITVAVQRDKGWDTPVSMLIHTSFKIDHHKQIEKLIEHILRIFKADINTTLKEIKFLYESEMANITKNDFLKSFNQYTSPDQVMEYPEWREVETQLLKIFRLNSRTYCSKIQLNDDKQPEYHDGIHLVTDNSDKSSINENEMNRLVYPTKKVKPAPAFIVIGGNTLSRGLTLEGLTCSYFLRNTRLADTLMQMGRWFGYRKQYELLPRIWLDNEAMSKYGFLAQLNEELRDELRGYAENGMMPSQLAPRIKNSSNYQFINITSRNKMQGAQLMDFDFTGFNAQTIYFPYDKDFLIGNYNNTMAFIEALNKPHDLRSNSFVWRGVSQDKVRRYLESYQVHRQQRLLANLPLLIDWLEKNNADFDDWNIIYSGVDVREDHSGDITIDKYSSKLSRRTKLSKQSNEKVANIGSLRNPTDLLIDIPDIKNEEITTAKVKEVNAIREKYGYDKKPLLIIYVIDKDSDITQKQKAENNSQREKLNLPYHAVGLSIKMPGHRSGVSYATTLSVDLSDFKDNIEEDFMEE